MYELPRPVEPVRTILIGAGNRTRTIYAPIVSGLKPWVDIVAVCDPVKEHADSIAAQIGARPYYDIKEAVAAEDLEAAIVVAPIPLHHAYSVFLSEHKIHNLIETSWCATVLQARDMIAKAKANNVYTRVGENFFRYPIDSFAATLRDSGYIGDIKRIFSYNDHTGYHNNSRWTFFAREYPEWISAFEHTMPTMPFYEQPQRYHENETFRARYISFPSGLMVIDQASNIKGMLGRQVRPGYTEWQGTMGTLVQQGSRYAAPHYKILDNNKRVEVGTGVHFDWTAEIRRCLYEDTRAYTDEIQPANPNYISKVERFYNEDGYYMGVRAQIPGGEIRFDNPIQIGAFSDHYFPEYGVAVAGHVIDFALQIRGLRDSEFNEQDALMSLMMEVAARESILNQGKRIALPLEGDIEADHVILKNMEARLGFDPLDVEAVLGYKAPRP
ncbi:MAG: Gfo/Idh/MocA family oxidoreductase [Firmicutes bacterium]|nr:Gfo/Idh/MocA family oxidoreductase [Bacillota bacterium]